MPAAAPWTDLRSRKSPSKNSKSSPRKVAARARAANQRPHRIAGLDEFTRDGRADKSACSGDRESFLDCSCGQPRSTCVKRSSIRVEDKGEAQSNPGVGLVAAAARNLLECITHEPRASTGLRGRKWRISGTNDAWAFELPGAPALPFPVPHPQTCAPSAYVDAERAPADRFVIALVGTGIRSPYRVRTGRGRHLPQFGTRGCRLARPRPQKGMPQHHQFRRGGRTGARICARETGSSRRRSSTRNRAARPTGPGRKKSWR